MFPEVKASHCILKGFLVNFLNQGLSVLKRLLKSHCGEEKYYYYCIFLYVCTRECSVAQSWAILCYSMDCSLSGSSVHEISQARIPEWVPPPEDLPDPVIEPTSLASPALRRVGRWVFYHCATRGCPIALYIFRIKSSSQISLYM